jgi:molybdopterin-guanine dinucleotide biosynthesis protein A
MQPRPIAVLLAGGRARRMGGGDKPLRLLGARTLLDHVIDRIRPQASALVLNANGDPARFAACGLPVISDPLPDHPGPLAGILAGMRWAAVHHPEIADLLSVPTDTPFLPSDFAARLLAARATERTPIACAAWGERVHPPIALWPVALADDLEAALRAGERKVEAWAVRHGVAHAQFDGQADPFVNINTPEELAAAERALTPPAPAPRPAR